MRRLSFAALGLAALVAGSADAAPAPAAAGLQLGQNLAGEACRSDAPATAARTQDIFCGSSSTAAGRVQVGSLGTALPVDATARSNALLARARTGVSGLSVTEQLACDGGQLLADAGSSDTVLFICTMQANSWPRIVIVSGGERAIYQAEGLPGTLPVLQAAIAAASGRPAVATATEKGQAILAMRLPPNVLRAGSGDFSSYSQFIELARLYGGANNFAGAEAAYRNAVDVETRLFGPNSLAVGMALAELALQVSNQGRFDEAAQLFQRATPIIEASPNVGARARLNAYLALDSANQRNFVRALTFARQATAARRAELAAANGATGASAAFGGQAMSSGELAHSLRIEAQMDLRVDDLAGAQAAAEEALWIISQEPGLPLWWRADSVSLMAEVNEQQGRVATAERDFLDALGIQQKLFGDSAPVVLAELRIGRFYTDQQQYPQALEHFRAALAILAKDPVARRQVVPDQIVPFITAATSIAANPQQRAQLDAEIFRASQLINSDVADQTIARASVRFAAGNPMLTDLIRQSEAAARARNNARIDLAAELAKPDDERDAQRQAQLSANLTAASARADQLLAQVQQSFPDYARLANPGPVELADVRAQLQPGEAFLSFVAGVRGAYGLLVTANGLTARKLGANSDTLAADIADLRRAFVPQLGGLPQFSLRNAFTLYTQVLGPFGGELTGVEHLIVAPGADLANLPLSLLVTADPGNGANYAGAAWLVRRTALSQEPSPRAFVSLRQAQRARTAPPRPFLGLGDPLFTGAAITPGQPGGDRALNQLALGCREAGPMPPETLRALPPLHDTAEEVNAVSRVLGGEPGSVLLGANATEANLRQQPLDQFGVLYFATHGLLPGELHCQSEPGLVLSPPAQPATTTDTDGLLDASEVAALKLNADLVVLAACNTAAAGGGRFGGGALEGLADAFFNAGARAVLASHWEVPSAATTRLMTGVFQRYAQNRQRGLAEALRQSQLILIAAPATAHPFNWAAFTLIGDNGANANTAVAPRTVREAANGVKP